MVGCHPISACTRAPVQGQASICGSMTSLCPPNPEPNEGESGPVWDHPGTALVQKHFRHPLPPTKPSTSWRKIPHLHLATYFPSFGVSGSRTFYILHFPKAAPKRDAGSGHTSAWSHWGSKCSRTDLSSRPISDLCQRPLVSASPSVEWGEGNRSLNTGCRKQQESPPHSLGGRKPEAGPSWFPVVTVITAAFLHL